MVRASSNRQFAKVARLRYVSCSESGLRRVRRGKQFIYLKPDGSRMRDERKLREIQKLALPPAWKHVWICLDSRGHLQATGYDARGRKQYRYHPQWRSVRDGVKYHELQSFGRALPRLRRRLEHDLASKKLSKRKVVATVISVMARTGLRVGNTKYAEENGSFGLTTLLDRHAHFRGSLVEFSFRGKGGKPYHVSLRDRRLAAIVKRCRDIPGQRLFQYFSADDQHHSISSTDVNQYLKSATGNNFSAKTFRTWTATLLAMVLFSRIEPAAPKTANTRQVNEVLKQVAAQLGNTPAICRKSYVDPRIIEAFSSGALHQALRRVRRLPGLSRTESGLLKLLSVVPAATLPLATVVASEANAIMLEAA